MNISQGFDHIQGIVQKMMIDLCLQNLDVHLLFIQTALVVLLQTLGQAAVQAVKAMYNLLQFLVGYSTLHGYVAVIGGIPGIDFFAELPDGAGQTSGQ